MDLWRWTTAVKIKWKSDGHINLLEARSILAMYKWRLRKQTRLCTKFLHLTDSQVNIAVMTRKRSSSHVLNLVSRKIAALELASCCSGVFGFVRSAQNPADGPSRE